MSDHDKKNRVLVMMATFNGASFIDQQINSILQQTDVEVDLYFRDDGSDDGTLEIVHKYVEENENVFLIEAAHRLGPAASFLELMGVVPPSYDYYAFSDQDDVWMPQKLSRCCEALSHLNVDEIGIAYCDYRYIDETGASIQVATDSRNYETDSEKAVLENPAPGFSIVMTRGCLAAARLPRAQHENVRMHDFWVHQVAFFLGSSARVPECLVDYRLHTANAVGVRKNYLRRSTYRKIVRNHLMLARQISLFVETFHGQITAETERYMRDFVDAQESSLLARLTFVGRSGFHFGSGTRGISRRLLFLLRLEH